MTGGAQLGPAALAFEAVAPQFAARFGAWASVTAQRQAVRRELLAAFALGGRILEIGGGIGEDAAWLARQGFQLTLTDASPAMVAEAQSRLTPLGASALVQPAEELDGFAERHLAAGGPRFDGAFSNFAPLNCVADLTPVGRGLARLLAPGAPALLVLFGTASPGEVMVECLCGRPGQALRRWRRDSAPARLGGRHFAVRYHRFAELASALAPWFRPVRRVGIGIFVPPSAAEPWISRHPRLLTALERLDRFAARPLAPLGDHVLYHFERSEAPAP